MCSDTLAAPESLRSRDLTKLLGKIGAGNEVPNADQLDPLDELSCHFSEPLVARMIHLVVQLPPGELPAAMIVCLSAESSQKTRSNDEQKERQRASPFLADSNQWTKQVYRTHIGGHGRQHLTCLLNCRP